MVFHEIGYNHYKGIIIITKNRKEIIMERSKVLEAARGLNESGLAKVKVKVVAVKMEELVSDFMSALETVPIEDDERIPDAVAKVYNALVDEQNQASPPTGEVAVVAESTTKATKATKAKGVKATAATAATAATEPEEVKVKFTRCDALLVALKTQGGDRKSLIASSDEIYQRGSGGKSNIKESKWTFGTFMPMLLKVNAAKLVDGQFQANF
jgi:hypothetical protein